MHRQMVESNPYSMDNLDLTLAAHSLQLSLSNEEINNTVRYDFNTLESFCDIDVAEDINLMLSTDELFNEILNTIKTVEQFAQSSPIMDDISELLRDDIGDFHSTESNDTANPIQSTDEQRAMIKSNDSTLPVIRPHMAKLQLRHDLDQSILLSESVNVTVPTPNQLRLVHPLESTYRARYKSDYFPQNGNVRRPRYVADNAGNHFVTLQMPAKYHRGYTDEYVRIALITTSINDREHYYSPYKFQTNHDDVKVPDRNPIYLPVKVHKGNDMILHLVLIKSKLDQLYDAQPLQLFSDTIGTAKNLSIEEKLASKDLINKYQLDKSHLAFTLCTKSSNGSYTIHPETTIISSVITESAAKVPSISTNKSIIKNEEKKISCPNCQHCFNPTDVDLIEKGRKRKAPTRTSAKTTTTNKRANKKKKTV